MSNFFLKGTLTKVKNIFLPIRFGNEELLHIPISKSVLVR